MRKLTITVTPEDIAAGVKGDACNCPIALACKRAGLDNPEVGCRLEYDVTPGLRGKSHMPKPAENFITAFDAGIIAVYPFTFDVDIEDAEDAYERRAEAYGDD